MHDNQHPINGHCGAAHLPNIRPDHLAELRRSGLSDETILKAGFKSHSDHRELASLLNRKTWSRKNGGGWSIPYFDECGNVVMCRVKPDNPPLIGGKPAKYLSPVGLRLRAYFPPAIAAALSSPKSILIITEGEKKALCASQNGFMTIGLAGVDCWHPRKSSSLLPELEQIVWADRPVYLAFDSDAADNENVQENERLLAGILARRGAVVRIVRLEPAADGSKIGIDDFLVANGDSAFHRLLMSAGEPEDVEPDELRLPAKEIDPGHQAKQYVDSCLVDGIPRLRWYRGRFVAWAKQRYIDMPTHDIRCDLIRHLSERFFNLGTGKTNDVMDHLRSVCLLPMTVEQPTWLDSPPLDWRPDQVLSARNGLVNLMDLADGKCQVIPPTPRFFSTIALDYDILPDAPAPKEWLKFLGQLWPDDQDSIQLLQEWFGYCLTQDTSQQKILMLVGPKRSGKGTIARVLRELLGKGNVCGPTLASFGTNFGLAPLLGKTLAIISDARLGSKTDSAAVVERLLSISGEDALTVDRKYHDQETLKLNARLMILTNELPRLGDSSGALAGRIVLIQMRNSFYGKEDPRLTTRLLPELPGILLWAIRGWRRLRDRGHFVDPPSGSETKKDMEDLASPIGMFIRERCVIKAGLSTHIDDLFGEWCNWCKANGYEKPGIKSVFARNLKAAEPDLHGTRPRCDDDDGKQNRGTVYEGIAIRSASSIGF